MFVVERVDKSFYMDSLTNLYSHRRFHEILVEELAHADATNTKVSVIIFDINNLSQINKDYGHAKGDEVIKVVANKINDNIKKQYVAARYAGDKIAVILKNMNSEEAKYMAEYLTYSLSCCLVDDIGPVNKLSVGIATYPDDANDNEKLIILAEQAVLVSKTKVIKMEFQLLFQLMIMISGMKMLSTLLQQLWQRNNPSLVLISKIH